VFHKGICNRKLGRLDESIEDLKKAVELKGEKAGTHNNLGLSYYEKEDFDNALAEFTKAIGFEPHSFHYNNRGLAYFNTGKMDEAKFDFDRAIELNPEDPFYYYNRGNVFLNLGQYEEAHADYDEAIKLAPNTAKFWHSKGLAFQGRSVEVGGVKGDKGLMEKAIEMYKQSLEIQDNFISSRFHLGLMYHKTH